MHDDILDQVVIWYFFVLFGLIVHYIISYHNMHCRIMSNDVSPHYMIGQHIMVCHTLTYSSPSAPLE